MFWTGTQLPFWARPLLTQEGGRWHFPVSQHNGEGGFPRSSQDRLDRGIKPEKRAPTFHAIIIFEVNPKIPGCWSFQGIFVHCLQPGQPSLSSVPPGSRAARWLLSSKRACAQGKRDSKQEFIGRGGTGRRYLKGCLNCNINLLLLLQAQAGALATDSSGGTCLPGGIQQCLTCSYTHLSAALKVALSRNNNQILNQLILKLKFIFCPYCKVS